MRPRQREALAKRRAEALSAQPRLEELERRLLALGGQAVVFRPEPDLELILARGRPFAGRSTRVQGDRNGCHQNASRLWRNTRPQTHIATGWALSDDGLWRQHTWLMRRHFVIETTERREIYFGVVLSEAEAEMFAQANGG
jgi:hypothetical protein